MIKKLDFKPTDIEKLYKDQSTIYTNFADDSFSWTFIEKPLIAKVLSKTKKQHIKILDAGCGTGRTLKYLSDNRVPISNIIGVDISQQMLDIATKRNPDVRIIKADLTKYIPKERYDLILCTHVLHYANNSDFKRILTNFHKLLNKEGLLFFVLTHPVRTTRHNLSEYFKNDWVIDHTPWGTTSPLFLRTVSDIVNATIEAGFNLKTIEEPAIPLEAKKTDSVNYLKYSCSPSRIAVLASK